MIKKYHQCDVTGCKRKRIAQGLCTAHYQQLRRYGSIKSKKIRKKTPVLWNDN